MSDPRSVAATVPLRPLTVGEILDGTFSAIRRNPRTALGLAALLVSAGHLLGLGVQLLLDGLPKANYDEDILELSLGVGGIGSAVITAIFGAVLTGMIVVIVFDDLLNRPTSARNVWRQVRPRIWALLAAAVLAGILPYAGLLILFIPGIVLWVALALTTPALMLEGLGPFRALRRSWQLAMPAFFRVWGIRALSVVLGILLEFAVILPFETAAVLFIDEDAEQLPFWAFALVALGSIVAGILVQPFYAGVLALLYVDRRMRAEGLDIAIQLANRERSAVSGEQWGGASAVPRAGR